MIMEDIELQKIWQSYDKKIEEARVLNLQSWAINLSCFESIQVQKVKSKLDSLAIFKGFAVVLGIIWVLFLAMLLYGTYFTNPYFTVSVSMIMLFSILAVVVYIKHIILIKQINYNKNLSYTQQKLLTLQRSTFHYTRILWLQMPFHTTWFWHSKWIVYSSLHFWLIPFPITLFFTLLSIYLYKNITEENIHKRWVRTLMMSGPEYKSVVKAREFISEIEILKQEMA